MKKTIILTFTLSLSFFSFASHRINIKGNPTNFESYSLKQEEIALVKEASKEGKHILFVDSSGETILTLEVALITESSFDKEEISPLGILSIGSQSFTLIAPGGKKTSFEEVINNSDETNDNFKGFEEEELEQARQTTVLIYPVFNNPKDSEEMSAGFILQEVKK